MTTYNGSDFAFFLADGYSLRDYMLSLKESTKAEIVDKTPLGWNHERKLFAGLIDTNLSADLLYDDAAAASDDYLRNVTTGNLFTTDVVCYGIEGNTAGKQFVGLRQMTVEGSGREAKKGDVHDMDVTFSNSDRYGRLGGRILLPLSTVTAAGQSSSFDGGAPTSAGGVFFVQAPAVTLGGYTNWSLTVQDSSTGSSGWEDVAGFAAVTVTVAPSASAIIGTGAVKRYTRVAYALTGAGAGPSLTAFGGLVRF